MSNFNNVIYAKQKHFKILLHVCANEIFHYASNTTDTIHTEQGSKDIFHLFIPGRF